MTRVPLTTYCLWAAIPFSWPLSLPSQSSFFISKFLYIYFTSSSSSIRFRLLFCFSIPLFSFYFFPSIPSLPSPPRRRNFLAVSDFRASNCFSFKIHHLNRCRRRRLRPAFVTADVDVAYIRYNRRSLQPEFVAIGIRCDRRL